MNKYVLVAMLVFVFSPAARGELVEFVFSGDALNSRGDLTHFSGETFSGRLVFETDAASPIVFGSIDPSDAIFQDAPSFGGASGLVAVEIVTPQGDITFVPGDLSQTSGISAGQQRGFLCCSGFTFVAFDQGGALPSTFVNRDVQNVIIQVLSSGDPNATVFNDYLALFSNYDNFGRSNVLEVSLKISFGNFEAVHYFAGPGDPVDLRLVGATTDTDGDGVPDEEDNCVTRENPAQIDADDDGFGNLCDADFNNDEIVNVSDLGIMRTAFFTTDPVVDLNSSGIVNVQDLGILRQLFFQPPGR